MLEPQGLEARNYKSRTPVDALRKIYTNKNLNKLTVK